MGEILTKTVFLHKMSHIQLNYAFRLFWSNFRGNSQRTFLFSPISEKSTEKLRKCVFLNMFEMGQILRKIWICLNNFFFIKPKNRGYINKKKVFLFKMSHIQLNYAFRLFWSNFGLIHWKLLFLFQKVTITEKSTEILRNFFS